MDLVLIAAAVVVVGMTLIYLLDRFVLRPRNMKTAQRLLENQQAEASRPPRVLKDTDSSDSSWGNRIR